MVSERGTTALKLKRTVLVKLPGVPMEAAALFIGDLCIVRLTHAASSELIRLRTILRFRAKQTRVEQDLKRVQRIDGTLFDQLGRYAERRPSA